MSEESKTLTPALSRPTGEGVEELIELAVEDRWLRAPFPWFGGKRRAADLIWERLGDTMNYVEPFAGSLAVLLARETEARAETVNDKYCFIANFWRALSAAPEEVAEYADWPVNEADLEARHLWLVNQQEFADRMKREPHYFDAKIAGWWAWGLSQWIGGGFCTERAMNKSRPESSGRAHNNGDTIFRKRPNLKRGGGGVQGGMAPDGNGTRRPMIFKGGVSVHRTNGKPGHGVHRQMPDLGGVGAVGKGVHRGVIVANEAIYDWFAALAQRLRRVRVCCGEWNRILGPTPTFKIGLTGVLLDPPYAHDVERMHAWVRHLREGAPAPAKARGKSSSRDTGIYAADGEDVDRMVAEVQMYCVKNAGNPLLRIALCGYEGEHELLEGWDCVTWNTSGGYGNQKDGKGRANAKRERIWFSPHCLTPQPELFT